MSQEQGVTVELLYKEVDNQLIEIGHNRQISIVRWIGLFVTKVLKKTCANLMVNEEAIAKVIIGTFCKGIVKGVLSYILIFVSLMF